MVHLHPLDSELADLHPLAGLGRSDVSSRPSLEPVPRFPEAACARIIRAPALVNVRLLRVRSVGASSAALFLTGACMYGAMFLLPLYYQELRGFDVLGAALVLIPVMTVAFVDIDPDDMPDASMLIRISQQLGGSFGVAIDAVVLESAVASGHTLTQAFGQAFWWTTGFTVLAVLASFFLPAADPAPAGQAARQPATSGGRLRAQIERMAPPSTGIIAPVM